MSKNNSAEEQLDKELEGQEVLDQETNPQEGQESPDSKEAEAVEPEAKSELEEAKEELSQLKDQHMRLFADFENHKKRTAKERIELFGTANMELMSALLPVIDDFKRALQNMEGEVEEGVNLIFNKFEGILKQKGLKPMESTIGKDFDVDTMEAITRIPAPDKKQKGKVVDEIEQGFYLGNKIIRYARVVVGE